MLIDHLQTTYAERCRRNPQYSLRAFAKALDIDSSTLSALIRRKRPLTAKTAQRLIGNLGITDPSRSQSLLLGVLNESDETAPEYQQLEIEAAEVISSWEHFAIRSLLQLDAYRPNTKQVARRLNIPHGIALEALTRMQRLGLVVQQGDIWLDTGKNLAMPSNVPSAALPRRPSPVHGESHRLPRNRSHGCARHERHHDGDLSEKTSRGSQTDPRFPPSPLRLSRRRNEDERLSPEHSVVPAVEIYRRVAARLLSRQKHERYANHRIGSHVSGPRR
jgi:transcriptional regulator with XRE-family HTH domain